ncbi:MAG TPA: excinuclease ABC subunit UvrC [Candidatus Polarisedimenticolaceae bacterium]|nr:excinuclease ABC subunit UvrC [Candidatus Polarisedimenticolaceae bacterium]
MSSERLNARLERLPARPGVYLYRNAAGEPIYIGKAKSLRARVRSYFQAGAQHPPRIARMVAEVDDLEVIVVDSEIEALILESNLVKRERPRYNVVLRDDKSFPYLKLALNDPYPRASLVRAARRDGNLYVGPCLPASAARGTLKLVQRFFRVATCKEVFDGRRRPCLYYHLDQCLAPCAGKTTPAEYGQAVAEARLFLEGRDADLRTTLGERMREASQHQEYERAARYRDTLRTLERLAQRQRMASTGLEEQDYLAHHAAGGQVALQLFQMRAGKVQSRREFTLEDVELEAGALYAIALTQLYADSAPPPEIYLPAVPDDRGLLERWLTERRGGRVRVRVPERGAKRRLLVLVRRNAELAFEARFRSEHGHGVSALEALAAALELDEPPYRIECFDVSNIQGADSVASLVVWEGGRARRSDYRSFNIRGVTGPDDFASIAEAVTRRYRRLIAEDRRLPDLVLIDGGAGQLGSAVAALARVGLPMLPVAALAKREEELYLPGRREPLRLPRQSPALQLLQRIRDEAHRVALDRHRRRRARRTLRSGLTELPGIGPATARKLLRAFGSFEAVRRADPAELRKVAGKRAADALAGLTVPPPEG